MTALDQDDAGHRPDPVLDKDGVRLTVDDAVATVTLTNPAKRNCSVSRPVAGAGGGRPAAARAPCVSSCCAARVSPSPPGSTGRRSRPRASTASRRSSISRAARRRSSTRTIAEYQEAFTWWRRTDIVSDRRRPGARDRCRFPARARVRPASRRRRRAVRDARDQPRPRPRPDGHPSAGRASWATPGRWRSVPPAASSTPRRPSTPVSPTSSCPPTSSTERSATWRAALIAAPRDAVVETKALLRGAVGRTYEEQRTAERAAQARRLRDLAGVDDSSYTYTYTRVRGRCPPGSGPSRVPCLAHPRRGSRAAPPTVGGGGRPRGVRR